MTARNTADRRAFLKGGALIAAPVAVSMPILAQAAEPVAESERIEDERAIARLRARLLSRINTGDHAGASGLFLDARALALEDDLESIRDLLESETSVFDFRADQHRAVMSGPCVVGYAKALAQDCTFAAMAHAQGSGITRHEVHRILSLDCIRSQDGWKIARFSFLD